jgi:hypothetical protein
MNGDKLCLLYIFPQHISKESLDWLVLVAKKYRGSGSCTDFVEIKGKRVSRSYNRLELDVFTLQK